MRKTAAIQCSVHATLLWVLAFPAAHHALAQTPAPEAPAPVCGRTITADVVALNQTIYMNRLGATLPEGMMFALAGDVVPNGGIPPPEQEQTCAQTTCAAGKVALRQGKRPRPIVLRMNVGDCLQVELTNFMEPTDSLPTANAGFHVQGLQLVKSIGSDGSWVGANPGETGSLVAPGGSTTYTYYANEEGVYMAYSLDDSSSLQLGAGLFGAVNVQPRRAEWYRSQVTREDLRLATYRADDLPNNDRVLMYLTEQKGPERKVLTAVVEGETLTRYTLTTVHKMEQTVQTATVVIVDGRLFIWDPKPDGRLGHPVVNYEALYAADDPITRRRCQPVLKMAVVPSVVQNGECTTKTGAAPEIYHTDLTAIITGPGADRFPYSEVSPTFNENPASPDRRQPYREFTIHYFNAAVNQAFDALSDGPLANGGDGFGINYGMAGIGAEILANRLGVGPMGNADAVDLKFEEFFLASWAVGDPAILVDVPANSGKGKATKALYADDPSNVYHSYMRDHVKFRVVNASTFAPHVHHQHAHQWLHTPNSDDSHYLDSQMVVPGSTYTLEMVYNGSGNRNQTVGDSIFHCHFYPHFAQGMWSLWRVHDVFEAGTRLDANGVPAPGWNRALPDGEIEAGTPIPAVVPLPTLAMAPIPARVRLTTAADGLAGRRAIVEDIGTAPPETLRNPGFPFFIPGVAGHRAPHPPMDFGWEETAPGVAKLTPDNKKVYLDGGLPRHLILDGQTVREFHSRWDFSKDFILYNTHDKSDPNRKPVAGGLVAFQLPEEGTAAEQVAMAAHATRTHASFLPNGDPGNFILNGLPPAPGAPYADPSVDDAGNSTINTRRYKAAVIQTDVVFNKVGWHYPQQRFITLWGDVAPSISGERPPQPFFFRANTGETVEFWHTNLVPDYYELDDFQVRTPTDILGQHIHLVKFDVTASDGASNGFNYEDGTLSPDEVRGRIDAINLASNVKTSVCGPGIGNGLFAFDASTQFIDCKQQTPLEVKPFTEQYPFFGRPPAYQSWDGAQTTVQRYDQDPLLNNAGIDRTLRTVFTHDHFGPSTHQQIGLYAGMLVEPEGSQWFDPVTGDRMGGRLLPVGQRDGGPTSWQANIVTANPAQSYREFALEFQDMQLAYTAESTNAATVPTAPMTNIPTNAGPGKAFPDELNSGVISPELKQTFAGNGITLHDGATVEVIDAGSKWTITDPFPFATATTGMPAEKYDLTLSSDPSTGLNLFTPTITPGWSDLEHAIAPAMFTGVGKPSPALISALIRGTQSGTFSLNYRNEPLPLRLAPSAYATTSASANGNGNGGASLDPMASDLSFAFASIPRANSLLNLQPLGTPINPDCTPVEGAPPCFRFPSQPLVPDARPTDPFTPLLRAYENDRIEIRTLVGAHVQTHAFNAHGIRWLSEPSFANSGYRNVQPMGLSEHFEMLFKAPRTQATKEGFADYLYAPSSGVAGLTNGLWGIMRTYQERQKDLVPLPNADPADAKPAMPFRPPDGATVRQFSIVAMSVKQALPEGALVYNSRGQAGQSDSPNDWIQNPDALVYVQTSDLADPSACIASAGKPVTSGLPCRLKPGRALEPLILRARAGDWMAVSLTNAFAASSVKTTAQAPFDGSSNLPAVTFDASPRAGLHPQVVSYDITTSNGVNVGFNPDQTVEHGKTGVLYWYAGLVHWQGDGTFTTTPAELGTTNLVASDPLVQHTQGLIGGLIIEPLDSVWHEDADSRASALVVDSSGKLLFREFVLALQVDANQTGPNAGQGAYNYKTEPVRYRFTQEELKGDLSAAFSNTLTKGQDPQTPVLRAVAGTPVRFRMLFPGGDYAYAINIHGHNWQELPWVDHSTRIGHNPVSQTLGSVTVVNDQPVDIVLPSAGGKDKVPGDYLYGPTAQAGGGGTWGVFRVTPSAVIISRAEAGDGADTSVGGFFMATPGASDAATTQVTVVKVDAKGKEERLGEAPIDPASGAWRLTVPQGQLQPGDTVRATTSAGLASAAVVRAADATDADTTGMP